MYLSPFLFSGCALDDHRDALPSADAERRKAERHVALLHRVQQRHEDARAAGTDRMTERDRAAVDVDLGGFDAELGEYAERLRGERLVELPQADVVLLDAGSLEHFLRRRPRAHA